MDVKAGLSRKLRAKELWCWRLLRIPWTARRSNQAILKEISPAYTSKVLQEEGPPARAQNLALVEHSEMNCPRRHMCWQSKRFYWERAPGWTVVRSGKLGKQLWLLACSLGFYSDGISFPLLVFSQSFWLRVLPGGALFSQDGCQREGFWEMVGHVVSPFDLSWTLPVGGGLLVPCSSPGPPVVKQLMQMVTMVPGGVGGFSQCASPNRKTDVEG